MEQFETFGALVRWLLTPAGLGLAVVAITAVIRRWAERKADALDGRVPRIAAWIVGHLWHVSVVVAAVLAGGAYVVQRFGLGSYVEEFWPLVLLVIGAVTWGTSQAVHNTIKAGKRWDEEVRG